MMKPNMVGKQDQEKEFKLYVKYLQTANAAIHYIAKSDVDYSDYYICYMNF